MKLLGGLAIFLGSAMLSYKITLDVNWSLAISLISWLIYWLLITLFYEW